MPVSYKKTKPIREWINEYSKKTGNGAEEILHALENTKLFLLQTSLQFHANREKIITPKDIEKILNDAAERLRVLQKMKSNNAQAAEMLEYCKHAIKDQLDLLYEYNDKIFLYYQTSDNPLKEVLENTPTLKK